MTIVTGLILLADVSGASCMPASETPHLAEIEATNREVREAFKLGDIDRIALFHHDNVVKSLGPDRIFKGKDALKQDLANTLSAVTLEFGEGAGNEIESLTICGDTAISISRFSIGWKPRDGSAGGTARGRAMIVLVKSDKAPHGWVTLKEMVQPLP